MPWDADAYLRFGDERTRPAVDLAARIAVPAPGTVVDLGCGPGNSTAVLRRRWPDARVSGVDASPEMIAAARRAHPEHDWLCADIRAWSPGAAVDVVFSNATLHWLGEHPALVRRLFGFVAPGGALAFQIPSDAQALVRRLVHEVADDPAWSARMTAARTALTMERPEVYYDALAEVATRMDLWETEYAHVMDEPRAIVEWMASTGMRPFLEPLATAERDRFTAMLLARVEKGYPRRRDGRVLFPFRRLFVIAYA
jgi:trans-aconitate 2-methyltransferase